MASIPAFLTDALEAQYGPALTAEILQGYASRRPVTLRVNTLKATPAQVQEQLTQAGLRYESVAWRKSAGHGGGSRRQDDAVSRTFRRQGDDYRL